jgi:hypothetical protein
MMIRISKQITVQELCSKGAVPAEAEDIFEDFKLGWMTSSVKVKVNFELKQVTMAQKGTNQYQTRQKCNVLLS